jgi:hypothetical protein
MLVFLAADQGRVDPLTQAARQSLAWRSVLDDADKGLLNLDVYQRRTAQDSAKVSEATLEQRLQETYCWLLVPTQSSTEPIQWEAIRIPGSDPYVVRATRKLRSDELLIARWSPALLRRELDRWLWQDAPHVGLRQVWEALAGYCYLPRLRDVGVLLAAVAEGVATRDYFAYADAVDARGRYHGLRFGAATPPLRLDGAAVLVRPEAAIRQLDEEGREAGASTAPEAQGPAATGTASTPGATTHPQEQAVRRIYGSIALDPLRTERDAGRVAMEIIQHLTGLAGAQVEVTLEISARHPTGFPRDVVRALRENCRTLKFRVAEFEDG